MKDYFVAVSCC